MSSDAKQLVIDLFHNEDYPQSKQFLLRPDNEYYVKNLLSDGRIQSFRYFISLLAHIIPDADDFLYAVLLLLYKQTVTDPPYYVSHAADHSVRTAEMLIKLYNNLTNLRDNMDAKYGLRPEDIKFALYLLGLLHDIGYSDLVYCSGGKGTVLEPTVECGPNKGIPTKYKFLHSLIGEKMIRDTLGNLPDVLGNEELYHDFMEAIREHNSDASKCKTRPSDECRYMSDITRHSYYIQPGETYTRNYIPTSPEENPLLFALRIADNLDMSYSRLSDIQRDPDLMMFQRELYMNKDGNIAAVLEKNKDRFDLERLGPIYWKLNEREFLFNYSNWIIENVSFTSGDDRYLLEVTFRTFVPEQLQADYNPYPALYQIIRLIESFQSLYLGNGRTLADATLVRFINGPTELGDRTYLLTDIEKIKL